MAHAVAFASLVAGPSGITLTLTGSVLVKKEYEKILVYKMKDFNEPTDGIVYGVCASLGFATLENFYYVY